MSSLLPESSAHLGGGFAPPSHQAKKNRAGGGGLKRKRPGYGSDSGPYAFAKPDFHLWHQEFATPQGSLNGDSVMIEIEVPRNQIVRFRDDPIQISFFLRRDNPLYQRGAGGDGINTKPLSLVAPLNHDPAIYVDELVEGQFIFSRCDVTLDGIRIDNGNLDDLGFHYRVLNRSHVTDGLRRDKYGRSYTGVAHSGERVKADPVREVQGVSERPAVTIPPLVAGGANVVVPAVVAVNYVAPVPRYTHPHVVKAMKPLVYNDLYGDGRANVIACGFDHVFPLGSSSNVLYTMTGQHNGGGYLAPGTKMSLVLHRRRELTDLVERMLVDDAQYWGNADFTDATPKLYLEIESVVLAYETAVLESQEEIDRITKRDKLYYHDTVVYRNNQLRSATMFENVTVVLPKGCLVAFLVFAKDVQFMPKARVNSYMSARYRYPPNLSLVKMSLVGKDGLVFKEGFHHLGEVKGQASHSLRAWHKDLVSKKLTDRPNFEDWFPGGTGVGYRQTLLLDLRDYRKHLAADPVDLKVGLTWSAAAAERWSLLTFALVQRVYTSSPKSRWTWKEV